MGILIEFINTQNILQSCWELKQSQCKGAEWEISLKFTTKPTNSTCTQTDVKTCCRVTDVTCYSVHVYLLGLFSCNSFASKVNSNSFPREAERWWRVKISEFLSLMECSPQGRNNLFCKSSNCIIGLSLISAACKSKPPMQFNQL